MSAYPKSEWNDAIECVIAMLIEETKELRAAIARADVRRLTPGFGDEPVMSGPSAVIYTLRRVLADHEERIARVRALMRP